MGSRTLQFSKTCKLNENWLIYLLLIAILYVLIFHNKRINCDKNYGHTNTNMKMVSVHISEIMSGKPIQLAQDDARVIKYIWDNNLVEPPSKLPYQLSHPEQNPSGGQEQFIQAILGNMANGFFVEVGGYEGELLSNSLWLEMHLGWKGLLVEADPRNFDVLKTRNRKAWISNTCLSIKPLPHTAEFFQHQHRSMGKLISSNVGIKESVIVTVQCLPLFSLLAAINVTTVDYFSLDVEGLELDILKTIPFDQLFIKTLSVEFLDTKDKKGQDDLLGFMESKSYKMIKEIRKPKGKANDFIFVHTSVKIMDADFEV